MTDLQVKQKRQGTSLGVWIPQDLKKALDEYVDESRPKTSVKAVVETALEDFLSKAGFWPPGKPPKPDPK